MMTWHFQPSPPMSTYLVAIVIGQLASAEREVPAAVEGGAPRKVAVWGVPDQVSNLEYAADAAAAILPAYERAFGIPYSLPKLDLVAIPDFSAGAMENWGLITYRQTALLVSPTSSLLDQRYVTKLVAHEMAHQVRLSVNGNTPFGHADVCIEGVFSIARESHEGLSIV